LADAKILVADGLGALTVREVVARFASGDITPVLPETDGRADAPPNDERAT
jgi:hypothetical protein